MRRHRRGRPHLQADGGCGLLKPAWFAPPDSGRRFLWSPAAAVVLGGERGLDLSAGLRVADVGCGWGYLGHLLLGLQPRLRVDGYDLDLDQLATARSRSVPGLRFHEGDALALEVRDGRYDRAVCQTLLVHQSRPADVLAELARIVRPGGRVVAIEPDWTDLDGLQGARAAAVAEGARRTGAGTYDVGARLPALFEEAGLDVVASWRNPSSVDPSDPDARAHLLWRTQADVFAADQAADRPLYDAGGGSAEAWEDARARADEARLQLRARLLAGDVLPPRPSPLRVCVGRVSSS